MNELQTKIQQFFANQNNLQKMKEVLARNNVYNDASFQELINSFVDGDRDIGMIGDYLTAEFKLTFETAEKVSDELMDAGLSEIYFDVYQNYTEHQKEMADFAAENFGGEEISEEEEETIEPASEEVENIIPQTPVVPEETPVAPAISSLPKIESEQISISAPPPMDLASMYQQFSKSSLFSNALEAEKAIKTQIAGEASRLKNIFYESINAADVVKVVGALRVIFSTGVKKFFTGDSRYVDFMGKFLSRSRESGVGSRELEATNNHSTTQQFNNNPTDKKYIISFIRLIIEKKLHLSETQSAMIGVSLGSLARGISDNDFSDIAYGDEENNKFVWSNE